MRKNIISQKNKRFLFLLSRKDKRGRISPSFLFNKKGDIVMSTIVLISIFLFAFLSIVLIFSEIHDET